jgi:peroxiredoxin
MRFPKHPAVVLTALLAAGLLAFTSGFAGDEGHDAPAVVEAAPAQMEQAKSEAMTMSPEMMKVQTQLAEGMKKAPLPVEVGAVAPDFTLTDIDGNEHQLSAYLAQGKRVVLEWFNPDCPFVKKHHLDNKSMAETYATAGKEGVVWLAINSGAKGKQGNGLERNQKAREEYKIAYPILLDESGDVGRAFGAKTTPHMFIIEPDAKVVYAGAIDNKPTPGELGDVNYVTQALSQCVAGKAVEVSSTKPYGCSVKYAEKPSSE